MMWWNKKDSNYVCRLFLSVCTMVPLVACSFVSLQQSASAQEVQRMYTVCAGEHYDECKKYQPGSYWLGGCDMSNGEKIQRYCSVMENGHTTILPARVIKIKTKRGDKCGYNVYEITCFKVCN